MRLQHPATLCNPVQQDLTKAAQQISLQRTAKHCNTKQYTAGRWNTLQHFATH